MLPHVIEKPNPTTAKAYEDHCAANGKSDSYVKVKELVAAFSAAFDDRIVETKVSNIEMDIGWMDTASPLIPNRASTASTERRRGTMVCCRLLPIDSLFLTLVIWQKSSSLFSYFSTSEQI